jgi:hypothetical protein
MPDLGMACAHLSHWCLLLFCHKVVDISEENTALRPTSQFPCPSSTIEKQCPKSNTGSHGLFRSDHRRIEFLIREFPLKERLSAMLDFRLLF